ncbi:type I glyceraldehyde-3-phosphate dehydrogenase [Candidatus Woesearchaeota archaeon]|nr:type I glyceraldehyde-3-phosphate dehydrogenase [Candidatus Woesearchaeota archaeon]RLE43128.1 MAG: type I glyceraldehyde-3-phosphate dehydrogenase [Candidatus Woesearchaeota archaeon]
MVRVAINGFGRIGRNVLKAGINSKKIEFVAINDLGDINTMAHLFRYDSVFGKFNGSVKVKAKQLIINNKAIKVFSEREPENLPWKQLGIDIVVESTGIFRTYEGAYKHIKAGAKKVLISAPAKGSKPIDKTIVLGVNHKEYDKSKHHIVSNASCTTNCLAPMAKVIHDSFGIKEGFMTTVHAYTNDQRILDGPHKDLRRARSCAINIVPTTTGAAKTTAIVIPELKGKIDGLAFRVPVADGSIVDFVVELASTPSVEEVNAAIKRAANGKMRGIIEYSEEPLVSTDIIGNPHSCIFDATSTMRVGKNLYKLVAWYDNEWGYSCRMVELLELML